MAVVVGYQHIPGLQQMWAKYKLHEPVPEELATNLQDRRSAVPIQVECISPDPSFSFEAQPPPITIEHSQLGVNRALKRDALALLQNDSNYHSAEEMERKALLLEQLDEDEPHPAPQFYAKLLEKHPWRVPRPAQTTLQFPTLVPPKSALSRRPPKKAN